MLMKISDTGQEKILEVLNELRSCVFGSDPEDFKIPLIAIYEQGVQDTLARFTSDEVND